MSTSDERMNKGVAPEMRRRVRDGLADEARMASRRFLIRRCVRRPGIDLGAPRGQFGRRPADEIDREYQLNLGS
jgi:hypothetical protein